MEIAKLTSKGQLTVPKNVRETLNLKTGDNVVFFEKDGMYFIANKSAVQFKPVNLKSISASMAIEGLETTDGMLDYAGKRINGQTSYKTKLKEIEKSYKNV